MKLERIREMRGKMRNTHLPGVDLIVMVISEKGISMEMIVRRTEDTQGVIDLLATMEDKRISTEVTLESTEEVLHKPEMISKDISKAEDLVINTSHMAMSVTIEMLLHTGMETEEELPLTTQVEGTKTTAPTGLTDTEENPVALDTGMVMVTGPTDRVLDLTEECLWNIRGKIPDNHQQGITNLNSAEDLHQQIAERKTSSVGDVEQ